MKRRDFVQAAAGFGAGIAGLPMPRVIRRRLPATGPRHWTWVHGGPASSDEWRRKFAGLRAAGIEGVLVSGGDLDQLANAAHGEGLAFHRWIWVLNRSGDATLKAEHPDWFSVSRSGDSSLVKPPYVGYYQWVCPTREPVRDYLRHVVGEIAAHSAVDGVHLDYIRHPDVILPVGLWAKYHLVQDREYPQFDFCYCRVCREAFMAGGGPDPLTLPDPTADVAWREFRWNSVTGVVKLLSAAVGGAGKAISAAVFPTPTIARRLVRQAWEQWPLDRVFPMLYHRFYEESIGWIGASTREGVAALAGRLPLHAGLYLPDLSPDDLGAAIRQAREAGAAGVSLFESGGLTFEHLARLKSELWT